MNKINQIHIISITDIHGYYLSDNPFNTKVKNQGIDRLINYIEQLHQNNIFPLIIDNGDSIQGNPLVDLHNYEKDYEYIKHPMNIFHELSRTDCFIPGNHEFNFGLDHLEKVREESNIPWIAANIRDKKTGKPWCKEYLVFNRGEIKIGVLGLITEYVPKWENRKYIENIEFLSVLETTKQLIPEIQKQCDFLIIAYHGGMGKKFHQHDTTAIDKENIGYLLFEEFPQVNLFITGHEHKSIIHPSKTGKRIAIQGNAYAQEWGEVLVQLQGKKIISQNAKLIPSKTFPTSNSMQQALKPHLKLAKKQLNKKLGTTKTNMKIQDPLNDVWLNKSPMIQWINEVMMQQADVDIAASPLCDIKAPGFLNEIYQKDLIQNYPFPNTICKLQITGQDLYDALEQSTNFFSIQNGNIQISDKWKRKIYEYDIWDGIEYEINLSNHFGKRITKLMYKNKTLEPSQILKIAVSSYRAGGMMYPMFSHNKIIEEYPEFIKNLLADDLQKKVTLKVDIKENFTILC